jgi:hypothetical protein
MSITDFQNKFRSIISELKLLQVHESMTWKAIMDELDPEDEDAKAFRKRMVKTRNEFVDYMNKQYCPRLDVRIWSCTKENLLPLGKRGNSKSMCKYAVWLS